MRKMKKALALLLVAALSAGVAVNSTLAYLQDEDSDVNVMTLGEVKIEQIEQERKEDGTLGDFTQAKPALPAVEAADGTLKNTVDKIVSVKNIGKSDAYVRTVVAIEAPEEAADNIEVKWNEKVTVSAPINTTIDGVKYVMYVVEYAEALAPGNTTEQSLQMVWLNSATTNEDCAAFGDSWEILVKSQAVQTAGFATAKEALTAGFGEIAENSHPWSNTVLVETDNQEELLEALEENDVIVNTDIVNVTKAEFDGNGKTVTLAGVGHGTEKGEGTGSSFGYLNFSAVNGAAKVEDLTVTGSGFVEMGHYNDKHNYPDHYEVTNLVVEDMNATLAIEDAPYQLAAAFTQYGTATLTDCVMTGTTTAVEGYTAYDIAFVHGTDTTIKGGEYGSMYLFSQADVLIQGAEVGEITSCTIANYNLGILTIDEGTKVGTIALDPYNNYKAALTVKAGATVDVLDLSGIANKSVAVITIEDGAHVGKIVANGVTYDSLAAWKKA